MSAPGTDDIKSEPRASWFGGASDEGDELVGTVLSNSYRVVKVLGEGAMGRVYEAQHMRLTSKRFAVKVLHPELMRHKQVLVRFEREAQATSTLEHPNIVGVYDVDRTPDGRPYIVCEFLEGIELGQLLDEVGTLGVIAAVHIARQLCRALAEAHRHGVLHRDMKPENVFVLGNDRARPKVKVLDFGLARVEGAAGNSLTQAGTIMGTPSYMAPEQARGDKVDARADVYAVGAILYRCLTGHRPFERDDPPATLAAVLTEEPPRPRSIAPGISEDLELIIQRAMARDASERYQTVDELNQELGGLEDDLEPRSTRTVPLTTPPPPRSELTTLSAIPRSTRPTLVVLVTLAFLWTLALIVSGATSAVELLLGRSPDEALSGLELTLLCAAVFAFLATPTVLGVRHMRYQIWNNSVRVGRLVATLRSVLFASMAAYGASALSVRLVDAILSRLMTMRIAWPPSAAAWPGWPVVYFLVGGVAAGGAALSVRWAGSPRRFLVGPVLTTAAAMLAGGIVYGGFVLRASTVAQLAPAAADTIEVEPMISDVTGPAPLPAPSSAVAEPSRDPATESELDRAIKEGSAALEALANAHPEDVEVMKALIEATARDNKQPLLALEWAGRLLDRAPNEASWKVIRTLVILTAQGPEPASGRAFEIMKTKMGSLGPDVLYELMINTRGDTRPRAQAALALPEVQKIATPALRIAFELREANTCQDQEPLLDRAVNEGDGRAKAALSAQVEGSKSGCGWKRKQACPPRCLDKALQQRIRDTMAKIKTGLGLP